MFSIYCTLKGSCTRVVPTKTWIRLYVLFNYRVSGRHQEESHNLIWTAPVTYVNLNLGPIFFLLERAPTTKYSLRRPCATLCVMGAFPSTTASSNGRPSSRAARESRNSGETRPSLRPSSMGPRPAHGQPPTTLRSYPPPPAEGSNLRRGVSTPSSAVPAHAPYPSPRSHSGPVSAFTSLPVNNRPPVQRSGVVPNVLNIRKDSLKLIRSPTDSCVYCLQFMFDAQIDGNISVFYCAQQVIQRADNSQSSEAPVVKMSYHSKGDNLSGKTPFVSGGSQQYQQNPDKGLDVRKYTSAELQRVENGRYPIVIRLEAKYAADSQVPAEERVESQTTFAKLVPKDGAFAVSVISQQVLVNGTIYKILNLYGIGGRDVTASKNQDDSFNFNAPDECVVCLTEPCDTACEPCNHLCLCEDCARALWSQTERNRRKCPVCRSELVKLLRIIPAQVSSPVAAQTSQTTAQPSSTLQT